MTERVRALLATRDGDLLLIRRERPGVAVYWVAPGGHVEPGDGSLENALRREIREELAATVDIVALVQIIDEGIDRQYIYLARITTWSFADRVGPRVLRSGTRRLCPRRRPADSGFGGQHRVEARPARRVPRQHVTCWRRPLRDI
jgi:8-oxo-dGTP pyrophosphatase MutT (NUDIX family)